MNGIQNTATILKEFWNSFGIPAYVEFTIPEEAELPYITYELVKPDWAEQAPYYARLWYRDTLMTNIMAKADEISNRIGSGIRLEKNGTYIYLFKDSNFFQFLPNEIEDPTQKLGYLSMIIRSIA